MRNQTFILEGAEIQNFNQFGRRIMAGWRHYLFFVDGKKATVMGLPKLQYDFCHKVRAKFYAQGTWEDTARPVEAGQMPFPKSEIIEEIYGKI